MNDNTSQSGYKLDIAYALSTTLEAVTTRFFDVNGRTSRRAFWHFVLVTFVVLLALSVFSAIPLLGFIFWLTSMLVSLALLLPMIGIIVRRMHDIGQPWFMGLIPLYNLYLAVQPGQPDTNAFGPPPQD